LEKLSMFYLFAVEPWAVSDAIHYDLKFSRMNV